MNWEVIIHIASIILGALASGIPIFIKWNNARKAKNVAESEIAKIQSMAETEISKAVRESELAKAEANLQRAKLDMLEQANAFIKSAEISFTAFDTVMKAQHTGTAGSMKKENVINKLQAYAISKGYTFDSKYWSTKIDEIVEFTKSVNGKK